MNCVRNRCVLCFSVRGDENRASHWPGARGWRERFEVFQEEMAFKTTKNIWPRTEQMTLDAFLLKKKKELKMFLMNCVSYKR